jgi:hypothetical protein
MIQLEAELVHRIHLVVGGEEILDRSCTDVEMEQFTSLVEQNPQLAAQLVEQLRINSLLKWQFSQSKRIESPILQAGTPRQKPATSGTHYLPMIGRRWR